MVDFVPHACYLVLATFFHTVSEDCLHEEAPHEHLFAKAHLLHQIFIVFVQPFQDLVEHYMRDALHHLSLLYLEAL